MTSNKINKLIELKVFTKKEALSYFGKNYTTLFLINCEKQKIIKHIRKNLYATISLESKQPIANKYEIGCKISSVSIISHHSALEFFGYYNQVFNEITIISNSKFQSFNFDDINYRQIFGRSDFGIIEINNIKITDLERTVIDCIKDFEKVCGLEELKQALSMIPSLDEEKLITYLQKYDIDFLYQKTGYLLEQYNLGLSNNFFEFIHSKIKKTKKYLEKNNENLTFNEKWNLYV